MFSRFSTITCIAFAVLAAWATLDLLNGQQMVSQEFETYSIFLCAATLYMSASIVYETFICSKAIGGGKALLLLKKEPSLICAFISAAIMFVLSIVMLNTPTSALDPTIAKAILLLCAIYAVSIAINGIAVFKRRGRAYSK